MGLTQEATASQKKMKSWTGKQEGACWLIGFIKTTFQTHIKRGAAAFPHSLSIQCRHDINRNENQSCNQLIFFFLPLTVSHFALSVCVKPVTGPLVITNSHVTHPTRNLFFVAAPDLIMATSSSNSRYHVQTHLHHPCWVHTDHHTDSPEGRVLLLVISDVSQRCAPGRRNEDRQRAC